MSFVGGGSDLAVYYRRFGGAVVSTAINKYVYITLNRKFDQDFRVSYSRTEEVAKVSQIKHPLVRESLKLLEMEGGLEITSIADIPSRGSGLGSSSSFTVGLLHALHAYSGRYASADQLARECCQIEIERCGEPIGKQDQYAAAFGGLNYIQFHPDESVTVEPILCQRETVERLQQNLLVFYTGITRSASKVLKITRTAVERKKDKQKLIATMVDLAGQLKSQLQKNNLASFGEIIHENWLLKRRLNGDISNSSIDRWYTQARRAGAVGGKLMGAGSGGFLMFYAPPENHEAVERALKNLRRVPFAFEHQGSRIIFVHQ
jgi:D-glycero-alpha-D-manno-heptose-7-phosphate kinase